MSVDLIVVTRLLIQGDYKYAKCISCSCKVFKSDGKYKCKKGHVHATKSWEFYFQLVAVSLKTKKILRKTLFGNSIISILGFTASQVKDLDDGSLLVLMRSLNDYLIGQMACISNKSNIITKFKLYNSYNLLQFLQKQSLEIKNSPFPSIEFTIHDTANPPETPHYSLIDLVDNITWEEWFAQISEPESEHVLAQFSDLKL